MSRRSKVTTDPSEATVDALKDWGIQIRKARRANKLTQQDLGAAIGCSRFTIAAAERGNPSTSVAVYMAASWKVGVCVWVGQPRLEGLE